MTDKTSIFKISTTDEKSRSPGFPDSSCASPVDKKSNSVLVNPLDSIFKTIKGKMSHISQELFLSSPTDLLLKTDVVYPEDVLISSLRFNDDFLNNRLGFRVYDSYLKDLLMIRFSLDRKSRSEFVTVNKKDFVDDNLAKLGSIKNLTEVRK